MAALFGWGADPFAELVEKATSELLPAGQEDIALNLEICDRVRAKQVPAKQAMQAIKKRISHKNPNVVLLALGLTDICIKNGGDHFIAEVASREFMDNLVSVLQAPVGVNADVKSKALKLVQSWAQIAEAKPQQMGYINDTYRSLKSSGFEFPPKDRSLGAGAAFVETMTAPEWVDSEVCMRCRTTFTTFNRKHHCRNCGQVFCNDCSSKQMALPWYGIGQDTRVCEACYVKKGPVKAAPVSSTSSSVPARSSSYKHSVRKSGSSSSARRASGSTSSRKRKEEDELALAIKLSLEGSGGAGPSRPGFVASSAPAKEGRPTRQADGRMMEGTDADDDPELAAAIAASLREYAPPAPSAPLDEGQRTPRHSDTRYGASQNGMYDAQPGSRLPLPPSLDLPASDVDALLTFSQEATRQEAYARQYGQWQANSGAIQQTQAAYERATGARPRMAKTLDEATRRQGVLNSMHDKLSEAVRLYDKLLDVQMQRPAYGAYGQPPPEMYGAYAPPQHQHQQHQQWSPQQYHRYADPRQGPAPVEVQAPPPGQEMYPTLPSQQQQAQYQHTGGSQSYHQQQFSSNDSYQPPESPSPYPYHQNQSAQDAMTYAQVGQAQAEQQGYGNGLDPQYAMQNYGARQYAEHSPWQQEQGHPQMPPSVERRDPGIIGPPSSQTQPQHQSQQPLHEAMAAASLGAPEGQQQAMPPARHESYESDGWLSNPSTQASGPASLRQQPTSSLDAAMPQPVYTPAQPTYEQQLAALPSTGKMPLTSPRLTNRNNGTPTAATFAMPPPPPQGFPGLTSPGQQHQENVWSRPVETPLIDL